MAKTFRKEKQLAHSEFIFVLIRHNVHVNETCEISDECFETPRREKSDSDE